MFVRDGVREISVVPHVGFRRPVNEIISGPAKIRLILSQELCEHQSLAEKESECTGLTSFELS